MLSEGYRVERCFDAVLRLKLTNVDYGAKSQ